MSDEFNILEYLNPKPDWMVKKRTKVPFVMPMLYQNTDDEENKDVMDKLLLRHLYPKNNSQPIVIRQVRHISVPMPMTALHKVRHEQGITRSVVVNAVRPYTKRTRTSCYWQDAGWEKRDRHLIGHYLASNKRFPGSIELTDSIVEPGKYYIYDPPSAVLDGAHGPCFRYQEKAAGKRKYWIHFSEGPADIDSGIIQIQSDLSDAVGAR